MRPACHLLVENGQIRAGQHHALDDSLYGFSAPTWKTSATSATALSSNTYGERRQTTADVPAGRATGASPPRLSLRGAPAHPPPGAACASEEHPPIFQAISATITNALPRPRHLRHTPERNPPHALVPFEARRKRARFESFVRDPDRPGLRSILPSSASAFMGAARQGRRGKPQETSWISTKALRLLRCCQGRWQEGRALRPLRS